MVDDDQVLVALSARLLGFRPALGLSLAELTERSKLNASTISRLERRVVRSGLSSYRRWPESMDCLSTSRWPRPA